MNIRKWLLQKLATGLQVPVYFELLPLAEADFNNLKRDFVSFPSFYDKKKFEDAVWPRPSHNFRVFIQID